MEKYDSSKLLEYKKIFQKINTRTVDNEYFENNFGDKFFSKHDARIIGEIRERIEESKDLNDREFAILIASLIYSADKVANTVGHYDAYRKKIRIPDKFVFELINPINVEDKKIEIYREDANK